VATAALCFVGVVTGIMRPFEICDLQIRNLHWQLDISMSTEINYKSNPLNGVGLKTLLAEIVDHYGFDILFAYLNINCFKTNPSIESSVKFLKKTDWAREKVEAFYLYEFKNLPKASSEQALLPPRNRIVPDDQTPGTPAELSLEDAEIVRGQREEKAAAWELDAGHRSGKRTSTQRKKPFIEPDDEQESEQESEQVINNSKEDDQTLPESAASADEGDSDPWASWKNKSGR
jgi:uncharacterized protein (DUF2132 family)